MPFALSSGLFPRDPLCRDASAQVDPASPAFHRSVRLGRTLLLLLVLLVSGAPIAAWVRSGAGPWSIPSAIAPALCWIMIVAVHGVDALAAVLVRMVSVRDPVSQVFSGAGTDLLLGYLVQCSAGEGQYRFTCHVAFDGFRPCMSVRMHESDGPGRPVPEALRDALYDLCVPDGRPVSGLSAGKEQSPVLSLAGLSSHRKMALGRACLEARAAAAARRNAPSPSA